MGSLRTAVVMGAVVLAACASGARPAAAQTTRADSAAALLRAAQVLEARGELRLARELLRVITLRFPESPDASAAREATRRLGEEDTLIGLGRAGFIAYHTALGGWLGAILPAALDVEGSEAYGAGLLIGGPLGFFGSRALAERRQLSRGQASIMQFASTWGTWQGLGWQAAADIGVEEYCEFDFCYETGSDTAPWAMAFAGGIAGLGLGMLASRSDLTEGRAAVISQGALWATWYGYLASRLAGIEDEGVLATTLLAGNAGLLLGIPVGRAWNPSAARVRTITAAGLAGIATGFGLALLTSVDEEDTALVFALGGTTLGLVVGTAMTRDHDHRLAGDPAHSGALVEFRDGWRIGVPTPSPTVLPEPAGARRRSALGIRIPLVHLSW